MKDRIPHARFMRLERFLTKAESTHLPPHLVGRWTKELVLLYLGYVRAECPTWPHTTISIKTALNDLSSAQTLDYIHDPVRKRAIAIREALAKGNREAADRMLEKLASDEEGRAIGSEIQAHNRSRGNKRGAYEDLLDSIFKENPRIGHKQLARELEKYVGKGVIKMINSSTGEIVLNDHRVRKIAGLKDQIYKRRKLI